MTRRHAIEAAVFAIGIAIGVACANDSNAQTADRVVPEDTEAVMRLMAVVRGANPLVCEMAVRNADMHGRWGFWGTMGGEPLEMDSTAAALLDWVQRSHNDPALVAPLRTGLRDADACVRRVASSLLARVNHSSANRALAEALTDAQAGTREVAAFGLGMANAHESSEALQARLRDEVPNVRRAAAWALGQLEEKRAVPALIEVLARDPDARVRSAAAWAIGSIR